MSDSLHIVPIERLHLALSMAAVGLTLAAGSPRIAASVAGGAALGALHLRVLKSASLGLFRGRLGGGPIWISVFVLRFLVLAAAVQLAVWAGAEPIAFVLGLLLLVPAALAGAWWMRPRVLPAETLPAADDREWDRWDPWLARERDLEEVEEDQA